MKYILILLVSFNFIAFGQNTDINILKNINLNRNKNLDGSFRTLSTSVFPISFGIPVITGVVGILKHDSTLKNKGLCVGASLIIAAGLTTGLKYAVNRPRPFVTYPELDKATNVGPYSFPSGHTSDAFATATSVSLAFPKWYVVAPSYLWACSIAYSRMDLGVHYPTDVLGGAVIGAGTAYVCYKANKWICKRQRKK